MRNLDESHYGGRARWQACTWLQWGTKVLHEPPPMTLAAARAQREQELGHKFTLKEARDFNYGWRKGAVSASCEDILGIAKYLNKDLLEQMGHDLIQLYHKYHILLHHGDER